jgi:hypothetical protein
LGFSFLIAPPTRAPRLIKSTAAREHAMKTHAHTCDYTSDSTYHNTFFLG